jgi:hypothetical protein
VVRYAGGGMKGLEERSRAPKKVSNRTSEEVERLIVREAATHDGKRGHKMEIGS